MLPQPPASQRLEFRSLTTEAIEALIARDREALELEAEMHARFPDSLAAPPERNMPCPQCAIVCATMPSSLSGGRS